MKTLLPLICIAVMSWASVVLCQEIDRAARADAEVSRFLAAWTKGMKAEKRLRRYQHKASVVEWSLHYDLDPLLVSRLMAHESSWRPDVRGARGEWGLMQIMNEKILKEFPTLTTDPDTNVKAGCKLLRECIDSCPSLKSAVGKYGSGHCTENGSWLESRWKQYQSDIKKFRKENLNE